MQTDTRSDFQRRIGVGERQAPTGLAGTARTTPVRNELTGGVAGSRTEHWSGRVDAVAKPDAVRYEGSLDKSTGRLDHSTLRPKGTT